MEVPTAHGNSWILAAGENHNRPGAETFSSNPEVQRDAQHILAMWDGIKNVVMQMAAKLNHLLSMIGRTEPASPTTEGEEILMLTIGAAHSGRQWQLRPVANEVE